MAFGQCEAGQFLYQSRTVVLGAQCSFQLRCGELVLALIAQYSSTPKRSAILRLTVPQESIATVRNFRVVGTESAKRGVTGELELRIFLSPGQYISCVGQ